MTCNPTTILLSSSGATTINVTLSTDPGDGTAVTLEVDGLSISESASSSSSAVVFTVAAQAAANYSLWDATIQVGSNLTVDATAQEVETNGAQTIGVTITGAAVSYCSPLSGGGGGSGTVTSITAGSGLTGGTITGSGTIAHQAQPASGTGPAFVKSVEIDSFGHVTSVTGETTAGAYRTATGTDDAANLTTGLLAAARVPDLDAAKIATGTIAAARLPAVYDSYTGQIETAADKTYTIDPGVVAARTITSFYARSSTGTCTATLKNDTDTVGVVSVTTSSTTAVISNASVSADDPITLVISSNSGAENVVFSVEFTQ